MSRTHPSPAPALLESSSREAHGRTPRRTLQGVRRRRASAGRILREQGATGIAFRIGQIALRRPWGHVEWFRVMETVPSRALEPVRPAWITDPSDPATGELTALGQPFELVRARLAAGGRAATARDAGGLMAYAWVFMDGDYDEEGILFRIRRNEAWVYDGATHPDHRGRRIYPRLVLGIAEDLAAEGRTRILSTIDVRNRSSLRSSAARGARPRGSVLMVRLFGRSVMRVRWHGMRASWRTFRGTTTITVP